jgi:hypothetical protein
MERDGIDSLLEMHLHGELPPPLRERAERILATPEGKRRLEEIRESDRRILEELPPGRMAGVIEQKLSAASTESARQAHQPGWLGWAAGASLAALCIALFAVVERHPGGTTVAVVESTRPPTVESDTGSARKVAGADRVAQTVLGTEPAVRPRIDRREQVAMTNPVDDGIRTKGAALHRLRVHLRKSGGGVVGLRDGDTVPKAAILQVSLAKGPLLWAAVVSVDGAGQATLHLPETGDSAAYLDEEINAPHSFQLDESPGYERFFLIVSTQRFSLDEALALTRRSSVADPVRKGWNIESIRVEKP